MRIAFVGKGGSGKSTLAAFFALSRTARSQAVALVDADINVHAADLLGLRPDPEKRLSLDANVLTIRERLRGTNPSVPSAAHMVKSTPPGAGSARVRLDPSDPSVREFATPFAPRGYLLEVGTYRPDELGTSCYHTHLGVFENILSHADLGEGEWIVADSVAGIDAFSNTLHAQFDLTVLVAEPTHESVRVARDYLALAREAGTAGRVGIVANGTENEEDVRFVADAFEEGRLIGVFPRIADLRRHRREAGTLALGSLSATHLATLDAVALRAEETRMTERDRIEALASVHRRYCALDYIRDPLGDLSGQADHALCSENR